MISLDGVSVDAGGKRILESVSLALDQHRVGLLGANGSGKSTLLRLVNGLAAPAEGTVSVAGLEVSRNVRSVRRRVGFVFQNPDAQIIMPTVMEDMLFGLQQWGVPESEQSHRAEAMLDRFGLSGFGDRPCHSLSGGEKQRLALAAVMVLEPSVLLLDEPTTLLDRRAARAFRGYLAAVESQVILATHNFDDLEGFDHAVVLDQGRVVFQGPPADAMEAYKTQVDS